MFYGGVAAAAGGRQGPEPTLYEEFGSLAGHLRYVERSARKLARSTFYGMARWQAKLEQKQTFLGRIVDIGAELFAISATVAYADTMGRERPERKDEAIELAQLFCAMAKRRADDLFHQLWANDDDDRHAAAQKVLAGRYTWLEEGILDPSGEGPMMPASD